MCERQQAVAVKKVSLGDWVRPYSSGIWKVSRILSDFFESRFSLDQPKVRSPRNLIFSNRLVNGIWKRSFSSECSELTWVSPVSADDRARIDDLLESNAKLRSEFAKYERQPKAVDLVINLALGAFPKTHQQTFEAFCADELDAPLREGVTLDEVLRILRDSGHDKYRGEIPNLSTLQLVSPNHELRNGEFVLRRYRVLGF